MTYVHIFAIYSDSIQTHHVYRIYFIKYYYLKQVGTQNTERKKLF